MNDTILVNFHCHTIFSDGEQSPEALAGGLAAAGVRCAVLTDHDSIDGTPRFQEVLKKRGVAFLTGVELTTHFHGREAHLLGYGFDAHDAQLNATLASLRQVRGLEVHSIAGSMRKAGSSRPPEAAGEQVVSAAPHGQLEAGEAIALIHRAGGRVFWAHPLLYEADPQRLDRLVGELKAMGLDGIEAIYAPFSADQQCSLREIAQKHALLVSAGTDLHSASTSASHPYGIEMPRADWLRFREAIFSASSTRATPGSDRAAAVQARGTTGRVHHFRRRSYILRIFLPTFLAIALFLAAIWGVLLPSFEQTLLDRKRDTIRELTNSAWSILAAYQRDEQNGLLSREQAQAQAVGQIESLRYGPDGKDYFWIQDLQPVMIMHPYRQDLNGQDLIGFTDPRGVPIFVQFADLVRREGEGYVDYVWQWNDDPQRLEPKESYVKGFHPWGWVIGTGIYTDDVHAEIARIEQRIINTGFVISGTLVLLLMFVLQQSLRIERERQEVVDSLRESTDRYHTLVEATTEGTLLVVEDRCRYANPTLLNMVGYTARQLEFLDLVDLLPRLDCNSALWKRFDAGGRPEPALSGEPLEGCLQRSDGILVECILSLNPMPVAGQRGMVLLVKDITRSSAVPAGEGLALAAQSAPVGIFRARAARRGVFLELNPAVLAMLRPLSAGENSQPALADLFADPAEYELVIKTLLADGEILDHIVHVESAAAATRFISLSARLIPGEANQPPAIAGTLTDVTPSCRAEAGREALIEKLQASLLFLHEPVSSLGRDLISCPMATTIEQVARLMTARKLTAALVTGENGAAVGIVTDHDLRARVLAEAVPLSAPVYTVMSAPVIRLLESALIYEALMRMEEKAVRHLALEDQDGQIVNVIDSKSLIQFQRYGPIVLSREIARAASPAEVARLCGRAAPLVKTLMDSSARPRHVTHMLSSIADAATERLIHLAVEELGQPPAAFAFIAMGSQGRQEQTLLTDQDHGIIFAPPQADPDAAAGYFLRLGERVSEGLDRAGYPFCRGKVMASNPRWCRSLPDWLAGFDEWVEKSEAQEIIDVSIFFDFRTVYGENELALALRQHIHSVLAAEPAFFHHFAQNALQFRPPFRLLGGIYLSGGATEHSGEINLKDAMMPIVSFARLYALRHQLNQTHTLERIEALAERDVIHPSTRDEIITAYDLLMQLRLNNQLAAIAAGRPPQNTIHPGKLGSIQKELLKQAFTQISAVQKKIGYDFLGGM